MERRLIALVIMAVVLFSSVSMAEQSSLELGMQKEDIIAILGEDYIESTINVSSKYEGIFYSDQKISKFDGFGLNLYFAEDILIAKEYCLGKEPNADKYEYLKSALIKKYGDSSEDNDVFRKYEAVKGHKEPNDESIASIVSDDSAFATWKLVDGTEIFLFVFNLSYSYHINYEITLAYYAPDSLIPEIAYDDTGL